MKVTKDYIAACVEEARREFIGSHSAELAVAHPFGLFVEADKAAADALVKLCNAATSLDLNEAQAEINDIIREQANVVAAREWVRREPAVYFAADDEARAA